MLLDGRREAKAWAPFLNQAMEVCSIDEWIETINHREEEADECDNASGRQFDARQCKLLRDGEDALLK